MLKVLAIILTFSTVLVIGFYALAQYMKMNQSDSSGGPVTITVWGLKEDEKSIQTAAEAYKSVNSNVTVNFVVQSLQNYRSRVQNQIKFNKGPDIFLMHNSWAPMFVKDSALSPLPSSVMGMKEFTDTFYPIAKDSFIYSNKIYAIPREADGLALFYNEDILKGQGISVPKFWDEFVEAATKVTVLDSKGQITTAGAALGTTNNIDYWSDLLGLLFLQQPGVGKQGITAPNTPKGIEVVKFYTNFVKDPNMKTWDSGFPNSTLSFTNGKLAFYFAPASKIYEIKQLNPKLNFKIAPVPQLRSNEGSGKNVAWASFWAYAVSSKSKNQTESWKFIKYLTSAETEKMLYQEEKNLKGVAKPYSRVDLAGEQNNDPLMSAFISQGPIYQHWYLTDKPGDEGVNDSMKKVFTEVVNGAIRGAEVGTLLKNAGQQIFTNWNTFIPAAK